MLPPSGGGLLADLGKVFLLRVFFAGIREEWLGRVVAIGNRSMDSGVSMLQEVKVESRRMRRLPEKLNVAEQYELLSWMLCEIAC